MFISLQHLSKNALLKCNLNTFQKPMIQKPQPTPKNYPKMTPKIAQALLKVVERKLEKNPQDRTPRVEADLNYLKRKARKTPTDNAES